MLLALLLILNRKNYVKKNLKNWYVACLHLHQSSAPTPRQSLQHILIEVVSREVPSYYTRHVPGVGVSYDSSGHCHYQPGAKAVTIRRWDCHHWVLHTGNWAEGIWRFRRDDGHWTSIPSMAYTFRIIIYLNFLEHSLVNNPFCFEA